MQQESIYSDPVMLAVGAETTSAMSGSWLTGNVTAVYNVALRNTG